MTNISRRKILDVVNKSAQKEKGFIAPPIAIIGAVVVGIIVIGIVSGGLKGSFKVTTDGQSSQQQSSEETNSQKASAPTSAPTSSSNFKTFTSEEINVSFEYPAEWKVNESSDTVTIALMEEGKTNNAAAAITAVNRPLGSAKDLQFSSIVDMQRAALKKEFNTTDFSVDKEVKVGDKEARLLEFTGNISGNSLTGKFLTTADKNNIYAITALADSDKWSKYSGDLQKALDSFKVLK